MIKDITNNIEKDDEKMINLTMTNFKTLETKKTMVHKFHDVENSVRYFFTDCDEIRVKNGNYFVYKNNEKIGGCLIKETKKINFEIFNGDVAFADLGTGDGTNVQCGVRPVIVVSNDACNKFGNVISVVPLTSQIKTDLPTHVIINPSEHSKLSEKSTVMCEQIISISKSKLISKIGRLNSAEMKSVCRAMKVQLNLND